MENMVFLGINLLLLMLLWTFCFKRAIRERKAEELRALKRSTKIFFLNNYDLSHPMYLKLSHKINCVISELDSLTLSAYISWEINIGKNPDLEKLLKQQIASEYATDDPKLSQFINQVRFNISVIGIKAMLTTSFYTLSIIVPITFLFGLISLLKKGTFKLRLDPAKSAKPFKTAFTEETLFLKEQAC